MCLTEIIDTAIIRFCVKNDGSGTFSTNGLWRETRNRAFLKAQARSQTWITFGLMIHRLARRTNLILSRPQFDRRIVGAKGEVQTGLGLTVIRALI